MTQFIYEESRKITERIIKLVSQKRIQGHGKKSQTTKRLMNLSASILSKIFDNCNV